MKKTFALILALALTLSFGTSVMAADTTDITTVVQPAYTVTIPADFTVPYGATDANTLTISANDVVIESGKKIVVKAKGSGAGDAFTMTNGTEALAYQLSKTNDPSWLAIAVNGEAASFTSNASSNLYAKVPAWNMITAGTYTGTITFTISYEDV